MRFDLKRYFSDFVVFEAQALSCELYEEPKYHYYFLTKCGYTTFEAIEKIATYFKLNSSLISYAGLKDEDGITMQFISIEKSFNSSELYDFNTHHKKSQENYIELKIFGSGIEKIKIGNLLGNNFRLKIRGLEQKLADKLYMIKQYSSFFINYYGPQRFGLPNQPKKTHIIGQHLIVSAYDKALELLKEQKNELGEAAKNYHHSAESFFSNIDQRHCAFLCNSYYSYLWNQTVVAIVNDYCQNPMHEVSCKHLSYLYPTCRSEYIEILSKKPINSYTKVLASDEGFKHYQAERQVVVQSNIICNGIFIDEDEKKWVADISMFLPAGCYATVVIPQLLNSLYNKETVKELQVV